MTTENKLLLTPREAAEILGIGRRAVYQLIDTGDLPVRKPGSRWQYIARQDVLAFAGLARSDADWDGVER